MVVLREYHSSEKDFILNYIKDHHKKSEHIHIKEMPSIDEVLRSQLKMFPISSDQGAGKIVLDIPANYTPPPTSDKSSVIETKIRGILANKQPTDFAVKMFEPLSNVVRKPTPVSQVPPRVTHVKPHSVSNAVKTKTLKPGSGSGKAHKSVKIKTPETTIKNEPKLVGIIKKEKPVRPKAKSVAKAIIGSGKGTAKITRPPLSIKPRSTHPNALGIKPKRLKTDKEPKVVKQGSVSFPRLVKLEKPAPKIVKRKKLVKTPEKKVATKPHGIQLKIA